MTPELLAALEAASGPRARALILVHPNNPTGTFVRRDEAAAVASLCRDRDLALIVDEVFSDYAFAALPADRRPSFAGEREALTFVLSGLSKVVAQPQLKLGWMVVSGPEPLVREALLRLEMIADTYLSVATPVATTCNAGEPSKGATLIMTPMLTTTRTPVFAFGSLTGISLR